VIIDQIGNEDYKIDISSEYMNQAKQIATIVMSGLEKEEYAEINNELSLLTKKDDLKKTHVFDYPDFARIIVELVLFSVISLITVYFMLISIGTIVLSNAAVHITVAFMMLFISVVVLLFNLLIIKKLNSKIKFKNRYALYKNILKFRNIEVLDDLAAYTQQEKSIVLSDLKYAVKEKLIPQGHFTNDDLVFIVSDEVYNLYKSNEITYDQYFKSYLDNKKRIANRTEETIAILDKGNRYIEKVRGMASVTRDKAVVQKLKQIEAVVSMIFHEVDVNPSQGKTLGMLLNYYLPTTEKLLDAYIEIDKKNDKGKTLASTKNDIENSLDSIICAFEEILEKLYKQQELDIRSEIVAMETMIVQEGLSPNNK